MTPRCFRCFLFLRSAVAAALLAVCVSARAQEALDSRTVVSRALAGSPAVAAAARRLAAATEAARLSGAGFAPRVEIAPGVGFTNGNSLLSRQIDVTGIRSALRTRADGELSAARAAQDLVRLQVAAEARAAYFDLVRAREVEAAVHELADLARVLREKIARRVALGEAPTVQEIRAGIEQVRAEQELTRARADSQIRLALLNRLLGRPRDAAFGATDTLTPPAAPGGAIDDLVEAALRQRPDVALALAEVDAQRGEVALNRSQGGPQLFADLAGDFWSLDGSSWRRRTAAGNLPLAGFQARLSFPLGRDPLQHTELARARADLAEREAQAETLRRAVAADVERRAGELTTALALIQRHQEEILPRSLELARATRAGFDSGISTFLEVLEAERVLRQTRTELLTALYDAVRARIDLDVALAMPTLLNPETSR